MTLLPWQTPAAGDTLSAVRDTSLSNLVREDVLGLILQGALAPGQRINEPDVASRLGVSRVPVREALRQLESSGLVVARKNAGVFVRQLGPKEVADLYQLRCALDGFAGRCAAGLAPAARKALVKTLAVEIDVMARTARTHDVQGYYSANLRFHWQIVEAPGNHKLTETYRGIVQQLHISRLSNLSHQDSMRASIAEHREIVDSLAQADPPRCAALLEDHVNAAYRRLTAASPPAQDTPP
ncbi:MAG TPA: FCD domain-containing protein [Ideonella sp.]|nr:FCD domain-containing protein [Ideonella sp.]